MSPQDATGDEPAEWGMYMGRASPRDQSRGASHRALRVNHSPIEGRFLLSPLGWSSKLVCRGSKRQPWRIEKRSIATGNGFRRTTAQDNSIPKTYSTVVKSSSRN